MPGTLGVPAKIAASRGGCKLGVGIAIVGSPGVYVVVKVKEEFGPLYTIFKQLGTLALQLNSER